MDAVLLIVMTVAMIAALAAGYLLGSKPIKQLRQDAEAGRQEREQLRSDVEQWRGKFNEAIVNLSAETQKVVRLAEVESQLAAEREAATALRSEVAAFHRGEAERERAHQAQLAQLKELEAKLETRFGELAGKAVEGAHDSFLKRAEERFGHAGQQSVEKLKSLLQPVEATLKRYEEGLSKVEKEREGSYRELNKAVELLRAGHTQVRDETARLVNALRSSPKARGQWGEQSLKNVLEQAGLSPFADFRSEVSVTTEDGRLRPDVIVRLPGGRKLIIDAKCSLNAFLDASDEIDEASRNAHMKAHVASIRRHAEQLGSKAYWQQFGDSADYVVMYIPGEHFLTAALEQALRESPPVDLWAWAFERRVLLATPTNLVAIARTVASVWRQERIAEQAADIARLGKELHGRLQVMTRHAGKLGNNLRLATEAYNSFVGSLESQVLTQARRFESLDIADGREIEALPVVEVSPRPVTKLSSEDTTN